MEICSREEPRHYGEVDENSCSADHGSFEKSHRKMPACAAQSPQLLSVLEHDLACKLRFAVRTWLKRIRDFLNFGSLKSRQNFEENFETFSIQLIFYFGKVLAPNQKIP